jgi:hypothetical protein
MCLGWLIFTLKTTVLELTKTHFLFAEFGFFGFLMTGRMTMALARPTANPRIFLFGLKEIVQILLLLK